MKKQKVIIPETRGRKTLCDWVKIEIGERVEASGQTASYWSTRLAPKKFVKRGAWVYRSA